MEKNVKDYGIVEGVEPIKSYIKTVPSKVYATVLSPWGKQDVVGIILEGNPRGKDKESCIVDIYSPQEDMFFKRQNARHLSLGILVPYVRTESDEETEELVNELTEEEVQALLGTKIKFFTLQSRVNKMTSIAPVFRLLEAAKELEKSQKIISFLEGKLAELQESEYPQLEETV